MIAYFLLGRERRCSYSVHEPPHTAADRVDRAEALEFIKEGFEFPAFILPPFWLAARGIWLGALAYFAAITIAFGLAAWLDVSPLWPALALLAIHLIAGAEADELHRNHLDTKGWSTVGHVTGTGALDCERRFYDQWLPAEPMSRNSVPYVEAPQRASQKPATEPAVVIASPVRQQKSGGVLGNLLAPLRRDK
jgi:Protein of unknown function (DUF2628)